MLHVLDIGANPAEPPPYGALMRAGRCRVTGFEPQAEAFEKLQATADDLRGYVRAAVGPAGTAKFWSYRNSGFASLFRLDGAALRFLGKFVPQLAHESETEIELTPLDAIPGIDRVDVLKIDVQGAETAIIAGGRETLADAVMVIPELRYYRLYRGEPLMGELDSELRAQGFELHKFLPPKTATLPNSQSRRPEIAALKSQLVDGDAVYIRRMDHCQDWPAERFARMAWAADGLADSPDLVLMCLDHLVRLGAVAPELPAAYADIVVRGIRQGAVQVAAAE